MQNVFRQKRQKRQKFGQWGRRGAAASCPFCGIASGAGDATIWIQGDEHDS